MRTIPLSRGLVAIVDESVYEDVSRFKWYANYSPSNDSYYARRNIRLADGRRSAVEMSRYILGITSKKLIADHINHNTLDNRLENLRACSPTESNHNKYYSRGKHGLMGVAWIKDSKKNPWVAQISSNGVKKYLGVFPTKEEAHAAYLVEARKLKGEFLHERYG